jgi:hypothetical protein
MELNGTKPKVFKLTVILPHLLKNCHNLLKIIYIYISGMPVPLQYGTVMSNWPGKERTDCTCPEGFWDDKTIHC